MSTWAWLCFFEVSTQPTRPPCKPARRVRLFQQCGRHSLRAQTVRKRARRLQRAAHGHTAAARLVLMKANSAASQGRMGRNQRRLGITGSSGHMRGNVWSALKVSAASLQSSGRERAARAHIFISELARAQFVAEADKRVCGGSPHQRGVAKRQGSAPRALCVLFR